MNSAACSGDRDAMVGSHGQALASALTAAVENVAAGLGLHAGTEAVHLGALAFLGLIGSEHGFISLSALFAHGASRSILLAADRLWTPAYMDHPQ